MERRLLLVFVLTFAVLLISQPLLMKYVKPQPNDTKGAVAEPKQPAPAPNQAATPPTSAPQEPAKVGTVSPATAKQATAEHETVVENDLYKITFTNRGAQVKSWILKKYDDDAGKPLELVEQHGAQQFGYPLSLWTYDEGVRKKLAEALYVETTQAEPASDSRPGPYTAPFVVTAPATLSFEYSDGPLVVRKSFHFDHSYVVKVETSVTNDNQSVRAFPAWPAGFGDMDSPAAYASSRIDWEVADKVNREAAKKVSGGGTINGPFNWAGPVDQYFGAVFLPEDPNTAAMITLNNSVEIPRDPKDPNSQKEKFALLGAAVGSTTGVTSERLFVGPKNLNVLESVKVRDGDLRGMIDFGFWSFISRPLFIWLRWTQQHWVANWGLAIILVTIIINLVLFPLRLSSMKSALKMQKLQPQVNAIKNRYSQKTKNLPMRDPRKLELNQQQNQEIAALFKSEGANPVGGCLPMLIQFPFLVAFYTMLGTAIELRHATFLWMHDLSSPDPYHILPILIIITMLFVQRLTPQAGMDPAQQKIMNLMMPVMLGVISWNLSSGLCVYWVVGNLISIIQQLWMNQTSFGREMRDMAAKRALKK